MQVELDALDPNDLRQLFTDAIAPFIDTSVFDDALADEEDNQELAQLIADVADRFTVDELRQLLGGDDDEDVS